MNQRANAALAGCAASPLPRWPRACVSARTPPSVWLASGRMMFLRHNQVHLESLRSNAGASARFIASLDTKLLRHPFGLCWEFFFLLFLVCISPFTTSAVLAMGELVLLQFTVNNSFSAFHVFILEYKIVAFSVDVSLFICA